MKNIKYILLIVVILCSCNSWAQAIKICTNDGKSIIVPFAKLDSIITIDYEDEVKKGFVDMGVSVKWATCNVGAEHPQELGLYFAWGEINPKESYSIDNCKTLGKDITDIASNPNYDAALFNWGSPARMPTSDEYQELIDNCESTWTTFKEVEGMLLISKINGNSLFFPATGRYEGNTLSYVGEIGNYWSSTPYEANNEGAYSFGIRNDGECWRGWSYRDYGHTVRAVSE